ncbi:MAG: hypothetical protein KAQ98_09045 [Bacteriovoracaceae bacterium]|nr:hypothetical protein [Bacteriovoracaceae bacterium]
MTDNWTVPGVKNSTGGVSRGNPYLCAYRPSGFGVGNKSQHKNEYKNEFFHMFSPLVITVGSDIAAE